MLRVVDYSMTERLRDGQLVEVRALRPNDRDDMLAAVGRTSAESLRRRFFGPKRGLSEAERAFFMNIECDQHVALVAEADDCGQPTIVGGARYVMLKPEQAELAFMVVDAHQGRGIATALLRHLVAIASDAGLKELTAEVLPENAAMLKVFGGSGFQVRAASDPHLRHLSLRLA